MYLTDTQSVSFNQEKGFFWDHKNYEDGNFSGKAEKFHWAWKPWFSGAGSKIKDIKRNNCLLLQTTLSVFPKNSF